MTTSAGLRIGIIDICSAAVVVIVLILPPGTPKMDSAYARVRSVETPVLQRNIADLEGRVAADPRDQLAAEELARQLEDIGQHDQALRVAGAAADRGGATAWRALRALSYAHAERVELELALSDAKRAIAACEKAGSDCDPQDQIRLRLYFDELEAGARAAHEGIDPVKQPERYRNRIQELHPTTRFQPAPK